MPIADDLHMHLSGELAATVQHVLLPSGHLALLGASLWSKQAHQ